MSFYLCECLSLCWVVSLSLFYEQFSLSLLGTKPVDVMISNEEIVNWVWKKWLNVMLMTNYSSHCAWLIFFVAHTWRKIGLFGEKKSDLLLVPIWWNALNRLLLTCAPIYELPSNISTMRKTGFDMQKN